MSLKKPVERKYKADRTWNQRIVRYAIGIPIFNDLFNSDAPLSLPALACGLNWLDDFAICRHPDLFIFGAKWRIRIKKRNWPSNIYQKIFYKKIIGCKFDLH